MKSSKSKSDDLYDEFYASVKLISGEEVLCLMVVDKTNPEHVMLDNPVICVEIRSPGTNIPAGYKFEPWIKFSNDQTFILETSRIITVSEVKDEDIIDTYKHVVHVASVHEYVTTERTFKVVAGSGGVSTGPTEREGGYANHWARTIWSDMLD